MHVDGMRESAGGREKGLITLSPATILCGDTSRSLPPRRDFRQHVEMSLIALHSRAWNGNLGKREVALRGHILSRSLRKGRMKYSKALARLSCKERKGGIEKKPLRSLLFFDFPEGEAKRVVECVVVVVVVAAVAVPLMEGTHACAREDYAYE